MDIKRAVALILLLIGSTVCCAQSAGIVDVTSKEVLLHVSHLFKGDEVVHFQFRSFNPNSPKESRQTRCCLNRPVSDFDLLLHEDNEVIYVLRGGVPKQMDRVFVGLALLTQSLKPIEQKDENTLQTGNTRVLSCLSQEGMHVSAYQASNLVDKLYLHFDYEIENPTCKP